MGRRGLYIGAEMDYDFDWDEANEERLLLRHHVRAQEVEEVFYGGPEVRREGDAYLAVARQPRVGGSSWFSCCGRVGSDRTRRET